MMKRMTFDPGHLFANSCGKNKTVKKTISFPVEDFNGFKIQMLNWADRFSIFCFLDNQHYDFSAPAFECLLGAGCKNNIVAQQGNAFGALQEFYTSHSAEWLFGHFGYDLKNETEALRSENNDGIGFDDLHFFVPEILVRLNLGEVHISSDIDPLKVFHDILSFPNRISSENKSGVTIQNRISKAEYIGIIKQLQLHILKGDCYEINFCQEFFAEETALDPLFMYHSLTARSPNPFSGLYKNEDKYCLCASPERYLKKNGNRICSQPIKGTSKRDHTNAGADQAQKEFLRLSKKEKSENVMVVDLVRNDLSQICLPGSVQVDELFGLYSFPQVHQMISTISGQVKPGINWIDCVRASFPMGSMTGAPKIKVMELIEKYERTKRGLFSGAIGYVDPSGDFDFNVVIRSLLYNAKTGYLSYQVGSAITFYSDAEKEYEECLLKAAAIKSILSFQG